MSNLDCGHPDLGVECLICVPYGSRNPNLNKKAADPLLQKQRIVNYTKGNPKYWVGHPSTGGTYISGDSYRGGERTLKLDLEEGWIVRYCWEDSHAIAFLLERL